MVYSQNPLKKCRYFIDTTESNKKIINVKKKKMKTNNNNNNENLSKLFHKSNALRHFEKTDQ